MDLISYDEVMEMFSAQRIGSIEVEPSLQLWDDSGASIVTIIDRGGEKFYSRLCYDKYTNVIRRPQTERKEYKIDTALETIMKYGGFEENIISNGFWIKWSEY